MKLSKIVTNNKTRIYRPRKTKLIDEGEENDKIWRITIRGRKKIKWRQI